MRSFQYWIGLLFFTTSFIACKKDNFAPPASKLSGKIVYQGEGLQLQHAQCAYQLYQDGFGAYTSIPGTAFSQEGDFSILLYDGAYKFTIVDAQAPFLWKKNTMGHSDTMLVNVKGNANIAIEVTPYYLLRNTAITNVGRTVTAKFAIEKIINDANARNIEYAQLFFNRTQFVAQAANYNLIGLSTSANPISESLGRLNVGNIADVNDVSITVPIPSLPTFPSQDYFFARVGLKIAGIEKLIYSPVVKLQL